MLAIIRQSLSIHNPSVIGSIAAGVIGGVCTLAVIIIVTIALLRRRGDHNKQDEEFGSQGYSDFKRLNEIPPLPPVFYKYGNSTKQAKQPVVTEKSTPPPLNTAQRNEDEHAEQSWLSFHDEKFSAQQPGHRWNLHRVPVPRLSWFPASPRRTYFPPGRNKRPPQVRKSRIGLPNRPPRLPRLKEMNEEPDLTHRLDSLMTRIETEFKDDL